MSFAPVSVKWNPDPHGFTVTSQLERFGMNLQEDNSRGSAQVSIVLGANLLLAGPSHRPIDPVRALAILTTEATEVAETASGGLRQAAGSLAQEMGQAFGLR